MTFRHLAAAAALASALTTVSTRAHAQPRASAPLDDPTIVAIFDAANTWDMETGALAARKGASAEVRAFGRMLARDHKGVRGQGRALAKKLGVHPTPPKDFALAAEHRSAMQRLRTLDGAAFDRAFLENEVAYHDAVIGAVTTTLLPAIQNAELKQLVTTVAPAFVAHRDKAKAMVGGKGMVGMKH